MKLESEYREGDWEQGSWRTVFRRDIRDQKLNKFLKDVTKTDDRERETYGKRENREPGIGNRESGTGNKCTAVTRLTIQNGVQRERKGNYLAKREEVFGCKSKYLMVSSPDDQYVLVKAESD